MGEGLKEIIFRINPTILKYVPHRHRAAYLNTHDLRSSTPTPYVAQRFATRACLEVPFDTFGGSIYYVWRLHSSRLEAPNALVPKTPLFIGLSRICPFHFAAILQLSQTGTWFICLFLFKLLLVFNDLKSLGKIAV